MELKHDPMKITDVTDFNERTGLVFCNKIDTAKNNAEILYISEAKQLGANAVFFRRYYKENGDDVDIAPFHSEPSVCIFDKPLGFFNSNEHIELHSKLWSSGKNEIYIIKSDTRVDFINARSPAKKENDKTIINPLETFWENAINEYDKQKFSAYLFETGTFWEQTEFSDKLTEDSTPHIHLLNYLMDVRREFNNKTDLEPSLIDRLLIISLLIKFLEEKKDENGKHSLKSIYKKLAVNNLEETVKNNVLVKLLSELANEFNGKIFDGFTNDERKIIEGTDLFLLADFLTAKIDLKTGQRFFWEQYSFEYLPAEVISAIYENFIQAQAKRDDGKEEKGVVYTPIHLVNFLIDEVMPLNRSDLFKNERFKVLDPACGSGVFLVAAFKRLLQWWAINNSSRNNIQYPNSETAQKILEENIFGVDVKSTATLVSVFSLTISLIDKLSPKEIWNNLRFKDLSQKNIQNKNFFEWAIDTYEREEQFDLVIGNPPFNTEKERKLNEVVTSETILKLGLKQNLIPDKNFALHFLEVSLPVAKRVCLILPANVLLYNKSGTAHNYREKLFTGYTVKRIFDFTHLRRDLFHRTADTPVVATIVENVTTQHDSIEHIVVKRHISAEKKLRFEIDYYDFHIVRWDWAIDKKKQFIWKTNLLGGGRLFNLVYRFSLLPTLGDFLFVNKQSGWGHKRGFEGMGGENHRSNINILTDINSDLTAQIEKNTEIKAGKLKDEYYYEAPCIIIKQVIGDSRLLAFLFSGETDTRLYFSRSFLSIKAPFVEKGKLNEIHELITDCDIKRLNPQLYVLATSSNCLILHETAIREGDIINLPMVLTQKEYLVLSDSEKIIQSDVLTYYRHLGKAISKSSAGSILQNKVTKEELVNYGNVFCNELNPIHETETQSWQVGNIYQTLSFAVVQFGFGDKGQLSASFQTSFDEKVGSIIENIKSNRGAIYRRIIRFYEHIDGFDCVFLIKPNALKYWLKSIALRDADDTYMDLKKAGM